MTDDDYLVRLLRLLDDEPARPTRVDLVRAIAEARRRRRARRLAGAGGAAALTVAVVAAVPATFQAVRPDPAAPGHPGYTAASAPTASPGAGGSAGPLAKADPAAVPDPITTPVPARAVPPPTACTIERLPIPGGDPMSLVTGADPSGRFILGRSYPLGGKGVYPVLIWDNGKATRVKLPGAEQTLTDATSTGVAVGSGWVEKGPLPYLVRNGRVTRLPGTGTAQARAINEAGRIVGTRDDRQPVVWASVDSGPVDLPLPGPEWRGEAADIDEDGTVVGVVSDDGGQTEQAYVWLPDGTGRSLPNPTVNGQPVVSFRPQSVRNGWVTGLAGTGVDTVVKGNVPVRLHLASGRFVGLPDSGIWPQHGNGQGWVAGSTADGRAILLTDDGPLVLPGLTNSRSSTANLAWRVSDDGRIVTGQSDNVKNNPQAVRWRCR